MIAISAKYWLGILRSTISLIFGADVSVITVIKNILSFDLTCVESLIVLGMHFMKESGDNIEHRIEVSWFITKKLSPNFRCNHSFYNKNREYVNDLDFTCNDFIFIS